MVKTIEQILGIHAMNQEDSAAEPMYGAFTDDRARLRAVRRPAEPDPAHARGPRVSVDVHVPAAGSSAAERSAFRPEGVVPANMESVYKAWEAGTRSREEKVTSTVRTRSTRSS